MKTIGILSVLFLFSSCVTIPRETILLSQTLGNDLQVLHNSHRNMTGIHFKKIKDDINSFVDDVYAPFIINYVLKDELIKYKEGEPSIYGTLEIAGKKEGKEESEKALNEMFDFQDAARRQIELKRDELISPIAQQESEIILAINQSYENAIYANSTITAYLLSVSKVKKAQEEALSMVGLAGVDSLINNSLVKISNQVDKAVKKGKEIDIRSEDALKQIEEVLNEIKDFINKD